MKLQYFGYLMWKADSWEKILMLEKVEGKRRRGQQRMRLFDSITDSMDINLSKLQGIVEDRGAWHAAVHGVTKSWTQLSDWTTTTQFIPVLALELLYPGKLSSPRQTKWSMALLCVSSLRAEGCSPLLMCDLFARAIQSILSAREGQTAQLWGLLAWSPPSRPKNPQSSRRSHVIWSL